MNLKIQLARLSQTYQAKKFFIKLEKTRQMIGIDYTTIEIVMI